VRTLKDQGLGIIIISHQMYDVFEVADRLAVMRRGVKVGERLIKETTPDEVVGLIVGSETVAVGHRATPA
jgi:ABC-type sugar transport system ATPase subunit